MQVQTDPLSASNHIHLHCSFNDPLMKDQHSEQRPLPMVLSRTHKKRKLDATDGSDRSQRAVAVIEECEDLWFEDGNIILIAQGIGFKVRQLLMIYIYARFNDATGVSGNPVSVFRGFQ